MPSADLLAVGLGNPGPEYEGTRHNAGAEAVRLVARRHTAKLRAERGSGAETAVVRIGGRTLVLAVPQTYVNDSGRAVRALVRRYLGSEEGQGSGEGGRGRGPLVFAPGSLVIVHDELDLDPGVVRVKLGEEPPATTGFARSSRISAISTSPGSASASASHRARQAGRTMS